MKILKINKFRKKLKEQLKNSTESLSRDLSLYKSIKVNSETAVFIEVNIAFYELGCEGFPGSINVIHKGNEVEDILSYCSKPYEIFPSFKGKALLTDELTENEEIGLESEDIVLDEIAKWFAEVWSKTEGTGFNLPLFVTQEDPISWFNVTKGKWTEQPLENDEDGNWIKVTNK